jgi:hypothetical protein
MNKISPVAVQGPSLSLLGAEPFRAAMEFAWHALAAPNTSTPGDGHPVVIFPGLGADGASVAILREHCRALGYDAFDWGEGFNTGPQGDLDRSMGSRIESPTCWRATRSQQRSSVGVWVACMRANSASCWHPGCGR